MKSNEKQETQGQNRSPEQLLDKYKRLSMTMINLLAS